MILEKITTNYSEEQILVKKILQGDKAALFWFWRKFKGKIFHYLKTKISDQKDAEEVFQDTFLAGLEGLRDFQFNSSLFTYLYSIARHKVIDYYRKKRIARIVFSHLPGLENIVAKILSPEEKLIKKELKQTIRNIFDQLAPIETKIIQLKYDQGLSVREIARELCLTVKACESKLYRARIAFIKVFNEEKQFIPKTYQQTKRDCLAGS